LNFILAPAERGTVGWTEKTSLKVDWDMRAINHLSAKAVSALGAGKYNDGAGLWLIKSDAESGKWVMRYTVHGRRREMGLGKRPRS
jgi:hypothetical protein